MKQRSQILREVLLPQLTWKERFTHHAQINGSLAGTGFRSCDRKATPIQYLTLPSLYNVGQRQIFASSKRRRPNENWCFNYKSGYFNAKLKFRYYNAASRRYYTYEGYQSGPNNLYLNILSGKNLAVKDFYHAPYAPGTDKDFSSRAYWTMLPRFRDQYQLLQQICELRDFKEGAASVVKLFREFQDDFGHGVKSLKKLKDIGPGDYWLTYALAVRPTVGAIIEALKHCLKTVESEQLRFGLLGASRSHYREILFNKVHSEGTWSIYYPWRQLRRVENLSRNSTMIATYDYEMRNAFQRVMSYWGMEGSYGLIWELTTLSFLWDYWIKIGNAISMMETDKNVAIKSIVMSESTLYSHTSGLHKVNKGYMCWDDSKVGPNGLQTGIFESLYRRAPVIPVRALALPRLSLPTGYQGVTTACIAFSMMK
jgi:hypothetical protein